MLERYLKSLNALVSSNPVNMVVQAFAYGRDDELPTQFQLGSPLVYYHLVPRILGRVKGFTVYQHRLSVLVQPHVKEVNPNNTLGDYNGSLQQFDPVSEVVQAYDSAHRGFLTLLNAQESFKFNNPWVIETVAEPYTAEPVQNASGALWAGFTYEFETTVKDELVCDYAIGNVSPC